MHTTNQTKPKGFFLLAIVSIASFMSIFLWLENTKPTQFQIILILEAMMALVMLILLAKLLFRKKLKKVTCLSDFVEGAYVRIMDLGPAKSGQLRLSYVREDPFSLGNIRTIDVSDDEYRLLSEVKIRRHRIKFCHPDKLTEEDVSLGIIAIDRNELKLAA